MLFANLMLIIFKGTDVVYLCMVSIYFISYFILFCFVFILFMKPHVSTDVMVLGSFVLLFIYFFVFKF